MAISSNSSTHDDSMPAPHNAAPLTYSASARDSTYSYTFSHPTGTDANFAGDVNTDNKIPSQATLKSIENFSILDQEGRAISFKTLYTGPNVARRVLVIFIRHFYCGNCQEYIRSLTSSVSPSDLLSLPTPTFIAIVGCGSPSLISMYQAETNCAFPIYADPTKKLYSKLGMLRTLNMGTRPEYQRKQVVSMMVTSFMQSMRMLKKGQAMKGGDMYQVGGEFLFEPVDLSSPVGSPELEAANNKQLGATNRTGGEGMLQDGYTEEKRVTWCHRMRHTRDHAEIPELREVLGLHDEGVAGKNKKRWSKALLERKGTGLSGRSSNAPNDSSRKEN
ncbi:fmHP [Diplocarpon rosae]|nr:fmHP [Diplocarpon rosae]